MFHVELGTNIFFFLVGLWDKYDHFGEDESSTFDARPLALKLHSLEEHSIKEHMLELSPLIK